MNLDMQFVEKVEKEFFRTDQDIGANSNTLVVWNQVRKWVGLSELTKDCLPAYCSIHGVYHVIKSGYGCVRKEK